MAQQLQTVDSVDIRMYRPGTGDFFILAFKIGTDTVFRMMVDCGCINGSRAIFTPLVADLAKHTGGIIDLLVVTHEHADHINGFGLMKAELDHIQFKKVWLAWTEDIKDSKAREYRQKITAMKVALDQAKIKLLGLKNDGHYKKIYSRQYLGEEIIMAKEAFIKGVEELENLNYWGVNQEELRLNTMADMLKENNVIKDNTVVEFLSPNELRDDIPGLPGIRFYILGPPRDYNYLRLEEKHGETYDKRKKPSTVEAAFVRILTDSELGLPDHGPFDVKFESEEAGGLKELYQNATDDWRQIDDDWLYSAGSLGLRLEKCINNTSLAIAVQFKKSEKVLLLPGDAEFGSWQSWKDNLKWTVAINDKSRVVDIDYLLNNTVFYKVSHHLSQNGTPGNKGVLQMTHSDLQAMVTLDLERILSGWKNTMPNDLIAAELIARTKGKVFFVGNRNRIMPNIRTDRVTVCTPHADELEALNKPFDDKKYIEITVKA